MFRTTGFAGATGQFNTTSTSRTNRFNVSYGTPNHDDTRVYIHHVGPETWQAVVDLEMTVGQALS
jgi:hypothetical protein